MFKKLYEWFRGEINPEYRGCFVPNTKLDNTNPPTRCGEKETPATNPEEPLPQPKVEKPKESFLDKMRREQAERDEIYIKELQQKVDEQILTEEEFNIGDQVQYTKVPNDNVEFYVVQYYHAHVSQYYFTHIESGKVTVQYFDANQILQTIKDEIKWFKKV